MRRPRRKLEGVAALFTPETMRFLRGLEKHNDRVWFEERRPTYERAVRAPLLALVEQINGELEAFAPEYVRSAHKVAMRIYRDTRFSPDKRPYKTNMAAWWDRRGLEKSSGAGLYLQVGVAGGFVAAGMYAPEREALLAVRRWLAEHHERYRKVLNPLLKPKGKSGAAMRLLAPQALTRNPKGFPPDHPASDLLRARNLGVMVEFSGEAALEPEFSTRVAGQLRRAAPIAELLNEALMSAKSALAGRAALDL